MTLELSKDQIAEYLRVDETTIRRAISASKKRLKLDKNGVVSITGKGGQEDN